MKGKLILGLGLVAVGVAAGGILLFKKGMKDPVIKQRVVDLIDEYESDGIGGYIPTEDGYKFSEDPKNLSQTFLGVNLFV